jgi:hypothetical protein
MYGYREDFVSGVSRWQDPIGVVRGYREIPGQLVAQSIMTSIGFLLPIAGLIWLVSRGGRR